MNEPIAYVAPANESIAFPHIERLGDVGPFVGQFLFVGSKPQAPPQTKKYRVLRLIEYTYDSAELMLSDMEKWNVPAHGVKQLGNMEIRSTYLPGGLLQHIDKELQPHANDQQTEPAEPGKKAIE